ncbi:MAG: hypothetical protein ACI97A_001289 [Planctomycetota bacterium]|jgi:hypothetical protein
MRHYKHTQPGFVIRFALILPILVIAALAFIEPAAKFTENPILLAAIYIVLVLLILIFHSLTVTVFDDDIVVIFGIGLIKKRILISDIKSATDVRNSPIHGWGIRWIKGGWCYNVSGLGAVELVFKSGKKFRIGSDEASVLTEAIQARL